MMTTTQYMAELFAKNLSAVDVLTSLQNDPHRTARRTVEWFLSGTLKKHITFNASPVEVSLKRRPYYVESVLRKYPPVRHTPGLINIHAPEA
jgi:hypothetical protein